MQLNPSSVLRSVRVALSARRAARLPRGSYAAVWELLSAHESTAASFVAGTDDESALHDTAQATMRMLAETVHPGPEDVVLEIGAGIGRVGQVLAPQCREWIGADVSAHMLDHMAKRLSGLPNVRFAKLSGHDLREFPDACIDVAYCTVVFMHLDEWDRFAYIEEAMRILKKGGRLLVDNINLCSDDGWSFFQRTRAEYDPACRPPYISRTSTPDELACYFRRAGFVDIQQRLDSFWLATYGTKPVERPRIGEGRRQEKRK